MSTTNIYLTADQKTWLASQPRSFKFSTWIRHAMAELTDFELDQKLPQEA